MTRIKTRRPAYARSYTTNFLVQKSRRPAYAPSIGFLLAGLEAASSCEAAPDWIILYVSRTFALACDRQTRIFDVQNRKQPNIECLPEHYPPCLPIYAPTRGRRKDFLKQKPDSYHDVTRVGRGVVKYIVQLIGQKRHLPIAKRPIESAKLAL